MLTERGDKVTSPYFWTSRQLKWVRKQIGARGECTNVVWNGTETIVRNKGPTYLIYFLTSGFHHFYHFLIPDWRKMGLGICFKKLLLKALSLDTCPQTLLAPPPFIFRLSLAYSSRSKLLLINHRQVAELFWTKTTSSKLTCKALLGD